MIGAVDPAGGNHLHIFAPGSGKAVIAIDDVETPRRDFGQQDGTRQIRVKDSFFIQMRAAVGGQFGHQDALDGEWVWTIVDKRQEPSDVELKNPVRVVLITRFDKTRLKVFVTLECDRNAGFVG